MFNKLHMQLTLFCMFITGTILIGLSISCLHISESGLKQNSELTFQNQISYIISYLEAQEEISTEWIATTQNNKQLLLNIEDNGTPLIFSELTQNAEDKELVSQAKESTLIQYGIDLSNPSYANILTQHVEFELTNIHNQEYKVSSLLIPKTKGCLSVVLLYSLQGLADQITTQRTIFLSLNIIALILLAGFSWFFTKKMIQPIEENRKKQIEFVASASHELRTPIMVIQSSLSAMEKEDPTEAKKFKDTIHMESTRMTHLINDMLTLARADSSNWNIHKEYVALDTLLVGIYEKYETIANERGISLSFELPDELMDSYYCDAMRMEQAFVILIDNAFSYTPIDGKVKLKILTLHNKLELYVKDNGPGVPDEEKKYIFERFYRAEKGYSEKEHFGLGLCIAKEIVTLHKGKLYVTDTPGGGATFVISLPLL